MDIRELKTEHSVEDFLRKVDEISNSMNLDYIDAVVYYCEQNNIELEVAGKIIKTNPKMKSKVQDVAESLNYLPKRAKLPI